MSAALQPDLAPPRSADDGLADAVRLCEAVLFVAAAPVPTSALAARLPSHLDIGVVLDQIARHYAGRGIQLARAGDACYFQTAPELAAALGPERQEPRRLSRAALEILSIIAWHQPVTRAEIEHIRGVALFKGTLDALFEAGLIRLRGRRRTPGRPVTYGTSQQFLVHFGLESIDDLPGLEELKAAGLYEGKVPTTPLMPSPPDEDAIPADEAPLGSDDDRPDAA
ncbi:MAG: SMC-Scp complex subunit ScpB [Hyphomicrobiales bacterium]|nr:SMC-Scp complex subunit ScpB [Hyphomicrobiales bacterium]